MCIKVLGQSGVSVGPYGIGVKGSPKSRLGSVCQPYLSPVKHAVALFTRVRKSGICRRKQNSRYGERMAHWE